MKVVVEVRYRDGVLDPAAEALVKSLLSLGFAGVAGVVQRRLFELDLETSDPEEALAQGRAMAEQLLANPVIESFQVRAVE